jgi:hypothetical protein
MRSLFDEIDLLITGREFVVVARLPNWAVVSGKFSRKMPAALRRVGGKCMSARTRRIVVAFMALVAMLAAVSAVAARSHGASLDTSVTSPVR